MTEQKESVGIWSHALFSFLSPGSYLTTSSVVSWILFNGLLLDKHQTERASDQKHQGEEEEFEALEGETGVGGPFGHYLGLIFDIGQSKFIRIRS